MNKSAKKTIACVLMVAGLSALAAEAIAQQATTATRKWDAAFFERLDFSLPELARVKRLVEEKHFEAARDALSDHFRSRRAVTGFWPSDPRSALNPDDLVNHLFSFYGSAKFDAGRPIRWNDTFLNNQELTYALNRHQHFAVLAAAFRRGRDPKYARAFAEQLRDWIAQNPSPDRPESWAAWRNLEVAARLGVWPDVFFQFLGAPDFTPDAQLLMLQSLHSQAEWIAPQVGLGHDDWSVTLASGLATVGVLFPEFKMSNAWSQRAFAALLSDLRQQILPDGSHVTFSLYHLNATVSAFWMPLKLAVESGVLVPQVYAREVEKICNYLAYIRRPDGKYPAFNASEPQDCAPLLVAAANFYLRKDFACILTGGQYGTTPTTTSCLFRSSGVAVMRDSWLPEANYLALDAGPYGNSYQHEDKLGFELAAYGRTALVDPGRYLLDLGDPLAGYLASTLAHNTITVDGGGQHRAQVAASWEPKGNSTITWISRPAFDYFAGSYMEGYDAAPDVQHHRRVLFVKNKQRPYWIISDRMTGAGKHKLESRWQFAPGKLEKIGDLAWATRAASGNLALCPAPDGKAAWSANVLVGSQRPIGGWVSSVYGKVEPAPQLIYDVQTSLPATLEYGVAPFRNEASALKVSTPQSAIRNPQSTMGNPQSDVTWLEIDFGDLRDTVVVAHDLKAAAREVEGCRTKGCFVVVRAVKGAKPAILLDEPAE